MFFNEFKYNMLSTLRDKRFLFWLIAFPIILGTFFKATMSSIYEQEMKFTSIPTAIVKEKDDRIFESVIESVSTGDNALIDAVTVDEEEALELLEKDKVKGIIYGGDKVRLSVSGRGISQTILKAFTDRYLTQEKLIKDTLKKDPSKLTAVTAELTKELNVLEENKVTQGNTDLYVLYYYNLIAMVAACSSVTGLSAAVSNQADMSAIGARKSCSATPKLKSILGVLSGCWLLGTFSVIICITFVITVLRVELGGDIPLVYISGILGSIMGTSMGFMIASLVRGSYEKKNAAAMIVSLGGSFLSGLMVGNIKPILMDKAPVINTLNPSAMICDSLYYLNIDDDYSRFTGKMILMLAMTVLFTAVGLIVTRRKKYASI